MVQAASALERLPHLARALTSGLLGPDKVLELCRFATPATERGLIAWARRVSYGAMRRRGELEERRGREQEERAVRERSCSWYFFDAGRRFHLEADLPAADGARVAAAMEEVARGIPVMPGEEDAAYAPAARRADALVALCTRGGAGAEAPARPRSSSTRRWGSAAAGPARTRWGGGSRGRIPSVLQRRGGARPRGPRRAGAPPPAGAASTPGLDGPPGAVPGRRLHVPRLRDEGLHRSPSHRLVSVRGQDDAREPHTGLRLPPSPRPRARLDDPAQPGRRARLAPPRRDGPRPRAGAPGSGRGPGRRAGDLRAVRRTGVSSPSSFPPDAPATRGPGGTGSLT